MAVPISSWAFCLAVQMLLKSVAEGNGSLKDELLRLTKAATFLFV